MPYKDPTKQLEYAKLHYLRNKKKYLDSNNRRRNELAEYVRALKSGSPCVDCGVKYPYYVMDFDHLENKEGLIKKFVQNNNRTGLKKEILKCEIVCSNCHRVRTFNRLAEKLSGAQD